MDISDLNIEELSWKEVRESVFKANTKLGSLLEQVEPKHTLFKARYLFNDKILYRGAFHLPLKKGGTIPLSSPKIPNSILEKIGYNYIPVTLILNNSVEVYFETEDRVMPSKLVYQGTTFGLWEAFDPPPSEFIRKVWNLSAGARSAFMLAKISDAVAHARLKKDYGTITRPPKKLFDHIDVFADLARHPKNGEKWVCEILLFPKEWLDEKNDGVASAHLQKYWIHEAWVQSFNCRNQLSYDAARESFSKELTRRNIKPTPYILNTMKHIVTIGEGIFPGLAPCGIDETAVPVQLIQEAYSDSYNLKQYSPIIMEPHHLTTSDRPVYYSFSFPTVLEYGPLSGKAPSMLEDIGELKMLMNFLQQYNPDMKTTYEFFHCEEDPLSEILHSSEIPKRDENFFKHHEKYAHLKFPDSSLFCHGCIKISKQE